MPRGVPKTKKVTEKNALQEVPQKAAEKVIDNISEVDLGDKLTEKQKAFVLHYLQNGGNAAQAARSAGYSENPKSCATIGSYNLRKPEIVDAIAKFREEGGDGKAKIRRTIMNIAMARTRDRIDLRTKMRALELMARIEGLLEPETQVNVNVAQANINPSEMSEQELLSRLAQLREKAKAKEAKPVSAQAKEEKPAS